MLFLVIQLCFPQNADPSVDYHTLLCLPFLELKQANKNIRCLYNYKLYPRVWNLGLTCASLFMYHIATWLLYSPFVYVLSAYIPSNLCVAKSSISIVGNPMWSFPDSHMLRCHADSATVEVSETIIWQSEVVK